MAPYVSWLLSARLAQFFRESRSFCSVNTATPLKRGATDHVETLYGCTKAKDDVFSRLNRQYANRPTEILIFWQVANPKIAVLFKMRYGWSFGDNDDRRQVGRGGDGVTVDAMRAFAS